MLIIINLHGTFSFRFNLLNDFFSNLRLGSLWIVFDCLLDGNLFLLYFRKKWVYEKNSIMMMMMMMTTTTTTMIKDLYSAIYKTGQEC